MDTNLGGGRAWRAVSTLRQMSQTEASGNVNEGGVTVPQRRIAKLCVLTGQTLMQYGAESALVENVTRRLGVALGADSVEVAIMANALTVTVLINETGFTTVRRNEDRGINMHMVTEVQRAMLRVEAGDLDQESYGRVLSELRPLRYPRWLLSSMIGLSCACFAALAGADWQSCLIALVAAGVAMYTRLLLATLHFNPIVTFFITAFVATSISIQGVRQHFGESPRVAMASCVLLLVPGVPLINAVSDMVKGYINTGISRMMMAILLAASTCAGIMLSMQIFNVWGWL